MANRPRIQIEPKKGDKILEATGWLSMVALFAFSIYAYSTLPETIPTHFNISGEADAYGGKATLWILPVVALATFLLLTFVSRYPHYCNYPVEITEANAQFQYRNLVQLMRTMKLLMILIFGGITVLIYCTAQGWISGIGILPILVVTTLPILPIVYFFIKMKKGR